jgi:hypothetical protein
MKKKIALVVFIVVLWVAGWMFMAPPNGYNWILKTHGGAHLNTFSDPTLLSGYAAKWAQDWSRPLKFFSTEIDSADPSHVKAGILSLSFLAACVESEGKGQVSAESKARFAKEFPTDKLNAILAKKPEYAEWAFVIERTSLREQIKLPKLPAPKP